MLRQMIRAEISTLGADEVRVVMSTAALARDGHVLLPQGCILDNYVHNNEAGTALMNRGTPEFAQ